jgi:ubiquinone biosynthesis protein
MMAPMSYLTLIKRKGEISRFRHVLGVIVRYGFGYLVERLNLKEHIPFVTRFGDTTAGQPLSTGTRLRLICEELGPTFIKFGQLLSTRVDIIPPDVISELALLQDHAPTFSEPEVRTILEHEYGKPPEKVFADFSSRPIAAASIAQVHKATLPSGERVVIKIQRPDIKRLVNIDLDILEVIASGLENYIPESKAFYPTELVRFFRKTINRELDFLIEARNAQRFRHNFAQSDDIRIPELYRDFCTPRLLVMEDLQGIRVDDEKRLNETGIDKKDVALRGARAFLRQVFIDRFFHADPHPGNFSVLPDGRIVLVDFGMVGRLGEDTAEELANIVLAIVQRNPDKAARHILRLNTSEVDVNVDYFKSDIAYLIENYAGRPLKDINLGHILNEAFYIAANYHIKLPPDLVLLGKAIFTMEATGRLLYPGFDMVSASEGLAKKFLLKRMNPSHIIDRIEKVANDLMYLLKDLPDDLQVFFKKISKGRFKMEFQHRGLETFISEMDKSSNRLSFGIIVAALIIGSSLITLSDKGPHIMGMPLLGMLGFVIAGLLGLWLIFGIMRSGKL